MNEPQPVGAAIPGRLLALAKAKGLDLTVASDLETPARETLARETPEERAERLAVRQGHVAARWEARLPIMYADATLDDLAADSPARTWVHQERSATLLLAGPVGTGKTHAAYAIGNWAVAHGVWVEAVTVHDLLEAMRPGGDQAVVRSAEQATLLVLDDLGATKPTEWSADELTALLDKRLRDGLRQIVTTNATEEQITLAWGNRLADRLRYRRTVALMVGTSRRRDEF